MSASDQDARARHTRLRGMARLSAVQALYQMEITGRGVEAVVREWREHRFGGADEAPDYVEADEVFFEAIMTGVVTEQRALDAAIAGRLTSKWRLDRIDSILRATLRAGAWELTHVDTPVAVAIDEYVEIAKAFFDGPESGFVNATLDALSKDLRT